MSGFHQHCSKPGGCRGRSAPAYGHRQTRSSCHAPPHLASMLPLFREPGLAVAAAEPVRACARTPANSVALPCPCQPARMLPVTTSSSSGYSLASAAYSACRSRAGRQARMLSRSLPPCCCRHVRCASSTCCESMSGGGEMITPGFSHSRASLGSRRHKGRLMTTNDRTKARRQPQV